MEHYYPDPGGDHQLPLQKHLGRLYSDTKKSSEFADSGDSLLEGICGGGGGDGDDIDDDTTRSHHPDPEVKTLHRRLRVQKNRLVSWGLDWSGPSATPSANKIDESLAHTGVGDIVGGIMSTIKDLLAEVELLWRSARASGSSSKVKHLRLGSDAKVLAVTWDKGRFADLVRDLTTSIDTLYILSRLRPTNSLSPIRKSQHIGHTESGLFESSRMRTPQQITPSSLEVVHATIKDSSSSPTTSTTSVTSIMGRPAFRGDHSPFGLIRAIVKMGNEDFARLLLNGSRDGRDDSTEDTSANRRLLPHHHLLLEYELFDPVSAITGVMPSMTRFERLSAGLRQEASELATPGSWIGLPRLLGYFEDMEQSRLGLVYQFPAGFNATSQERVTGNTQYDMHMLHELLLRRDFQPPLEVRFRMAHNLASTIFNLHSRGIGHGNLLDTNVVFGYTAGILDEGSHEAEIDMRRPLLTSFNYFPKLSPEEDSKLDSKLDNRLDNRLDSRPHDLIPLAMLLLEIGFWEPLEAFLPVSSLVEPFVKPKEADTILKKLAVRCGNLFARAISVCWGAKSEFIQGSQAGDTMLLNVQARVSGYLEACCIIDMEDRLINDLGPDGDPDLATPMAGFLSVPDLPRSPVSKPTNADAEVDATTAKFGPTHSRPKTRLYPQVPVPPEAVKLWNTVIMSQMNAALRSFYRKNPESVEISLESIGLSPTRTQPTVLVVCTSVAKVRTILKRKMADVFTSTSPLALKVCTGRVLRSCNRCGIARWSSSGGSSRRICRSIKGGRLLAGDGKDPSAFKSDYQEVPTNGASIGAWIGYRHLPPVSFGGLVVIDNQPYGMTVHHILDEPEMSQPEACEKIWRCDWCRGKEKEEQEEEQQQQQQQQQCPNAGSKDDNVKSCGDESGILGLHNPSELPDDDSSIASGIDVASEYGGTNEDGEYDDEGDETEDGDRDGNTDTDTDIDTDDEDDNDGDDGEFDEPGDIPGVEPGCGEGYAITQPALEDVKEGFFPSDKTADEDHLSTFTIGDVYATSGIRRRRQGDLVHEIDWALFSFRNGRKPVINSVPTIRKRDRLHPTAILPSSALPNLRVQCMARTSGLQTGQIMPSLTSVKIYGRTSPAHAYQVYTTTLATPRTTVTTPIGLPGDSGAWIVSCDGGNVAGHVLAWSTRKGVAYICPMDVLLQDMADTLCAREIRLPGGEVAMLGPKSKPVVGGGAEVEAEVGIVNGDGEWNRERDNNRLGKLGVGDVIRVVRKPEPVLAGVAALEERMREVGLYPA